MAEHTSDSDAIPPLAREFIVEFLASLVPGVAFMLGVSGALIYPLHYAVHYQVSGRGGGQEGGIHYLLASPMVGASMVVGLLITSYIVGHIFFRQDPKTPDGRSAKGSWRRVKRKLRQGTAGATVEKYPLAVWSDSNGSAMDVQFPYLYLWEFLHERGLGHLARHVPWRGTDSNTHSRRSKHFINGLKIRIELFSPASYSRIARNEAHVRLMSSMWFASVALVVVSLVGLLFPLLGLWQKQGEDIVRDHALTLPVLVLFSSMAAIWGIERALLYQRQREIVFVLETADWINKREPQLNIFEDLTRPSTPAINSSVDELVRPEQANEPFQDSEKQRTEEPR